MTNSIASYTLTRDESLPRAKKGGEKYAALHTWCIEGEYVTHQQMAERLGCNRETARKKHHRVKGTVTWEALKNA